jgi:biotin operon repressor
MNDIDHAVRVLKTMADETRLRILGLLAERPRTGRELADALDLSAPTISHHLQRLAEVGVISSEADGVRRVHRLDSALLDRLRHSPEATAESHSPATPIDDAFYAKTVRTFFDGARLRSVPAKRKARVVVLLELLRRFQPSRSYSEPEVNEILRGANDDVAYLRRELVDYRYLERSNGVYRVTDVAPARDANESQEVPSGEADWLAGLIAATVPRVPQA